MSISILIVDDDPLNRDVLQHCLDGNTFQVDEANCSEIALQMTAEHHYGVVFLSMRLPDMSAPQTAKNMRAIEDQLQHDHSKIIAICDRYPHSKHIDWQRSGFDHSLGRPLMSDEVVHLVTNCYSC